MFSFLSRLSLSKIKDWCVRGDDPKTWLNDINIEIIIIDFLSMCDQPGKNKKTKGGNAVWDCRVFMCLGWNYFANEEVEPRVCVCVLMMCVPVELSGLRVRFFRCRFQFEPVLVICSPLFIIITPWQRLKVKANLCSLTFAFSLCPSVPVPVHLSRLLNHYPDSLFYSFFFFTGWRIRHGEDGTLFMLI